MITREELEDRQKWMLDWKSTLLSNSFLIFFLILVFVYMWYTLAFVTSIENENTQLIALIVYMFSVLKLLTMTGQPTIHYKERVMRGGDMKGKIIVPVAIDLKQCEKKILSKPEIRVWCHPKKGDDYFYIFDNVPAAMKFIKRSRIAEETPLFAFNGYEFDLLNVGEKKK